MYRQNFKSAQFVKKDTDQSIETSSENNETSVAKEASGADILKGFRIIYIIAAVVLGIAAVITGNLLILFSAAGIMIINSVIMYALERIIDLLYQIKRNTDKE